MALEISLTVLAAVVIALVQIAKSLGLDSKYAGLLAIVLGIAGTLSLTFSQGIASVIFTGVVVGLSACGLYSQKKKLF